MKKGKGKGRSKILKSKLVGPAIKQASQHPPFPHFQVLLILNEPDLLLVQYNWHLVCVDWHLTTTTTTTFHPPLSPPTP